MFMSYKHPWKDIFLEKAFSLHDKVQKINLQLPIATSSKAKRELIQKKTQTKNRLSECIINLTKKFPWEDIHLKKAFSISKKVQKIEIQLSKLNNRQEKRKLTKEKLRLDLALTDCLTRINIKQLKGWQILSEWESPQTTKGDQLEKALKELHGICSRLAEIEPEVRKARKELIKRNLRLVVSISRHYQNRGVSLRDLIQEGNIGLIRAVEKFDHQKGFRLTTYASWWIRESIIRAIEEKSRVIRIPVYINERFYKIKKAIQDSFQHQGKRPTIYEIAQQVKMPPREVLKIMTAFKEPVSLESQITEDVDPLLNYLSDNQQPPLDRLCDEIIQKEAASIIETLPEREASILKLRFGIGKDKEKTLEEVGKEFQVSRERVRQLENNALKKLRKNKKIKMLFTLLSND
jgi:RNA polymerase sigma factor (sigma-70 family)